MIIYIIVIVLLCTFFGNISFNFGKKIMLDYFREQKKIMRKNELVYRFLFIENIEDLDFLSDLENSKLAKYDDLDKERLIKDYVYLIKNNQQIGWVRKGDWLIDEDPLNRIPGDRDANEESVGLIAVKKSKIETLDIPFKKNKKKKRKI